MAAARVHTAACLLVALFVAGAVAGPSGRPRKLVKAAYSFCNKIDLNYENPLRGTPPPPLSVAGNRVINAQTGKHVPIRGLNWFGFNVGMGMVDGLWVGGHEGATDFALIAYQLRLLGYNAVRLPFTWRDLTMAPKDLVKECTPLSPDQLKRRLISPNVVDKYINLPLPSNVSPQRKRQPGFCNQYLPMRSNYHRLLFVAQSFIAQGMYVVLDYQPQGLEQQPYSLSTFVSQWTGLWKMVACLPNFESDVANRIFVDVMNEPDSMGIRWESSGGRPGAAQLYLATADSLWGLTPNKLLFMFEGTGQNGYGLNWGNGFITDSQIIQSRGLSDPNPFFKTLLTKPYVDRSILTPHVYPPSITHATFLGTTLWEQCRASFGYLQTKGYCPTKSTPLVDLSAAAFEEPVSASAILPNVTVITDAVVSAIPNVTTIAEAVVNLINNSSGVVPNATVIADAVVHIIADAVAHMLPAASLFPNISDFTSTLQRAQPPPLALLDAIFRRRLQQADGEADAAPAAAAADADAAAGSDGDGAVVPAAADASQDTDGDGLEMDWEVMDSQIAAASADSADARERPAAPRQACKIFPVLIGETGSAMTQSADWQWLNDFASFINSEGAAAAYNPVPVNGWMWWAYNENSGDTGGIVKNYWQDLHWDKLNFMIGRMGLRPWYLRTSRRT
ncbi:glycoside hydrolase [Raphidocelis subcapitata]|uniref:Glycoside hydrolase n=1 Tax=Raphidocelis subcapitata TaxID=307507 RepID=A0A2V0P5U4_9CHLO|nr:glycoside hydrolase [Raphidocelis subcapitata]|eukprot:GBF93230.1 glycoside hydrolase [Raphidocelis subcapitata]